MEEDCEELESLSREQQIFEKYPVRKAVAAMAIPTVISQVITVIYNLADTWYVGLTGNAATVAAISLCLPVYCIMTAIGNLFGIGGSSVIARAIGAKRTDRAQAAYSLALRGAFLVTVIYSLALLLFARPLLLMIGGEVDSIDYAVWYTRITMIIGGIPTILSAILAHLIRSTGQPKIASFGITLGAILNMVLDPLFMFVILPKGNEVIGAAIATALSNCVAMIYFIAYVCRNRSTEVFRFSLPKHTENGKILSDILKCGLPSFTLLGASQISNLVLNSMLGHMGSSAAIAGIGVVRKIDSLAYSVNQGITQGMLPIVAYCFAANNHKRMKSVIGFSTVCTVGFSLVSSICSFAFAPYLIRFFIDDSTTIFYGTKFLRVLCIAVAIYPALFVIIAVFQAVGQSKKPFLLSLLHKGSFDIPLFFVIRQLFGTEYILWASPIMAFIALTIAGIMLWKWLRECS